MMVGERGREEDSSYFRLTLPKQSLMPASVY